MPNRSKQKGNRIERELVNLAKSYGLESQRAYASDGRSLGLSEKVDLLVGRYKIQAKGRSRFPKWLTEAYDEVDAVVFKEDRKEPVVMISYERFLKLIEIEAQVVAMQSQAFEDTDVHLEETDRLEQYQEYASIIKKLS